MATNLVKDEGDILPVVATDPAEPNSGDPIRFGVLVGVALADEGDGGAASTETIADFGKRVWRLNVDDNEGSGISPGDKLYYHDTGTGSPTTSINNSSTSADAEVGIALGTISANGTDEIDVLITPTT